MRGRDVQLVPASPPFPTFSPLFRPSTRLVNSLLPDNGLAFPPFLPPPIDQFSNTGMGRWNGAVSEGRGTGKG